MKDVAKKAFYLGICAAAVTKRFVEAEVKRYLEAGNITETEGKKIVDNAMKQLKKDRTHFESSLRREVKMGMKEAKPLIKESRNLVEAFAKEIVKEAKSTVSSHGKQAARRVKKVKTAAKTAARGAKAVKRKVKVLVKKKASSVKRRVVKKLKRR